MRERLEIVLVFSFIIAAVILLAENSSITGFVSYTRELSTENPGVYSFYPLMKAYIDYDFSDYEKIKKKTDEIVASCADKLDVDLINCLKDNLNKINDEDFEFYLKYNSNIIPEEKKEDWYKNCEKADESFFYDFVEFVDSCQNSAQSACYCSMNIFDSNLEFEFDVKKEGSKLVFKYNDKEEPIEMKKTIEAFNKIIFDGDLGDDEVKINEIEFTKNIYLRNTEGEMRFTNNIDVEKEKRCKSENRHIKVCVLSKKRKIIAENKLNKKDEIGLRPVITRLALYIKDLPPPPVNEVNVFDKAKASASIMLNWSESEATDVVAYNIYYSDTDFEGKKTKEFSDLNKVSVDVASAKKVKSIDIFNPMCQKLAEKRCKYLFSAEGELMSEKIELSNGMLIYEEKSKSFIYILPIENEKEFYFGISAIDRKGQESEMIIKTDSTKSIDDLAPGKVAISQLPLEANGYKLTWQRPLTNIDGTELKPDVALTYDLYACKNLISSGSQLTSVLVGKTDCNDFKIIAIKDIYPEMNSEEYKYLLE